MDEMTRRKAFQWVKTLTNEKFWAWMNWVHSRAYAAGVKHMQEAMNCHPRISQRMIDEVMAKAKEIRETWDGMQTVSMDETEAIEFEKVMGRMER